MPIVRHGYAQRKNVDSAERARNRATIKANATHCAICGRRFEPGDIIEADHIQPVADLGNHDLDNLQATHRRCNRSKGRGGAGGHRETPRPWA